METKNIDELIPDSNNFNKGTDFGNSILEKEIERDGTGRSIYVDADNNIIAGNKTAENAMKAGIKKVRIIDTVGDELIAVRRTDVKIDSEQGRRMALADNAIAAVNLDWDMDNLRASFDVDQALEFGVNIKEIDYSVLDGDDLDNDIDNMADGVKKAIQIEFIPEHYEEAQELVKFWRERGAYIGSMLIEYLKLEKQKL